MIQKKLFTKSFVKPLEELLNVLLSVLTEHPRSTWDLNTLPFIKEVIQLLTCKEPILSYEPIGIVMIQPIPKEAEFTL